MIANLVPACGKCNLSKGNKHWETWIGSTARLSPLTRGAAGLADRVERLRAFEQWREPLKVDFGSVVGEELWAPHWQHCDDIHALIRTAQATAEQIKATIRTALTGAEQARHHLGPQTVARPSAPVGRRAAPARWEDFARWLSGSGYQRARVHHRGQGPERAEPIVDHDPRRRLPRARHTPLRGQPVRPVHG